MVINSRTKGAAAEREFAGLIHDHLGIKLIRNLEQTRSGGHDLIIHPDEQGVVVEGLDKFALEIKRYAQATPALIKGWWGQAQEQAEDINKQPALAYRANQRDWIVMIPMHAVNKTLPMSHELEYTASFTIHGFCSIIREL